jgi:hypothetical protein
MSKFAVIVTSQDASQCCNTASKALNVHWENLKRASKNLLTLRKQFMNNSFTITKHINKLHTLTI